MRAVNLIGLLILGIGLAVIAPQVTTGQPGGYGKKGGGPGGPDPGTIFDFLAKGRNFFLISESRRDGTTLAQFAQERGISNGQITRQQYLDFAEWRQKQAAAGMMPGGFGKGGFPGGKGGFPGGMQPPGGAPNQPSPEAMAQAADIEFNKRDRNKDNILTPDEMPRSLRDNLSKWDKNGDGNISLAEFREYFADLTINGNGGNGDSGRNGPASIIIQEEDLDAKPVVYRAGGAMPAGLPAWFKDLDTDGDGQIAPYEWRRAGKSMDEFANWDLNGDGFITPDEALKQQSILAKNSKGSPGNSMAAGFGPGAGTEGGGQDPRKMFFGKRPDGNGGGSPFGGGRGPGQGGGPGSGGFGKNKKNNKDRGDKPSDQ